MLDIIDSECMRNDDCLVENCMECDEIEECYTKANDEVNGGFAKSIGYGGYNSEDDFWDNL